MTKIYNLILACFISTALISCSDDNNDNNTPNPVWKDPSAKYVDYAVKTAKSMGYEKDVKIVEKTTYETSTIDLTNNKITKGRSTKETYYFDVNGALIKSIVPINYSDKGSIYTEDTYVYDSLYRVVEHITFQSDNSGNYYIIEKREYNEKLNTATVTTSRADYGSNNPGSVNKYVYKLDENGRIKNDDVDVYNPRPDSNTRSISKREAINSNTTNYNLKVERDSKNNILTTYVIYANNQQQASNTQTPLYAHSEQTITYYDGKVSKPNHAEKSELLSPTEIVTANKVGLKGNPKSLIQKSYLSTKYSSITMDKTNQLNGGELNSQQEFEFDKNGYASQYNQHIYIDFPFLENGSVSYYKYYIARSYLRKYEYDSQNRIKTYYNKTVSYSYNYNYYNPDYAFKNPTITTKSTKTVYTYDDVNNIVTEVEYLLDDDNTQSVAQKAEREVETKESRLSSTPNLNQKTTRKYDDKGNIILQYYLRTYYDKFGILTSQEIPQYFTDDITYY